MDYIILEYIKQQIKLKGFKNFNFQPFNLYTKDDTQVYVIKAYNEFLYLVSKELVSGTIINSDTNIFTAPTNYPEQTMVLLQEFTGLIIIENPISTNQLIEFIRVLPY